MGVAVVAAAAALAWLAVESGSVPDRTGWHEFVVPSIADERTEGSLVDLSHLNAEPAGAGGFLRPDGERIVDGRGREVRLFGSNICDLHVMPPKEMAPRMARRMRQLGMNFTRLHYYDWAPAPQGMMAPDMQGLDPAKLDQMDYLIAELKANGIYIDLNLHVARQYPGTPDGWSMGKAIDYLHEPLIQSQMRFARDVVSHVNPYTRLSYAREPAIALFELNNENTAMPFWGGGIDRYASLAAQWREPLEARFTSFLRRRYGTSDAVRRAWNADPPAGPNLLKNGDLSDGMSGWTLQNAEGARSTADVRAGLDGVRAIRWVTSARGASEWNMQIHQASVPVRHGQSYTLRLRARSATSTPLKASMMLQQAPWNVIGAAQSIDLTPEWREVTVAWTIVNPGEASARLNLSAENRLGEFELSSLVIQRGEPDGLPAGKSLEGGIDIRLTNARKTSDILAFLHEAEMDYARRMRDLIKKELGAGSMLLCSQVDYGGASGMAREATYSDLADVHAYPAHPTRGADGWSWVVRHVSLTQNAFGGSIPLSAAACRIEGKPLLCTEFDLNPPNHYAGETFPYLAILGSYQGLAGMLDYSWFNFQDGVDHRRINSSFATTGHAGQMAMIPVSMAMYRLGLIRRAAGRITLRVPSSLAPAGAWVESLWRDQGAPGSALLQTGMATRLDPNASSASVVGAAPKEAGRITSDTGEIVLDRSTPGAELLTVNAPAARCAFGFVVGRDVVLGDVRLRVTQGFDRYANVALVALDGKPVRESRKLLLTTLARVENRDMTWNEQANAVRWGSGPTVAEPVHLSLTLPAGRWSTRLLDGSGQAVRSLPMSGSVLRTEGAGVWYLIERS